MWYLCVCMEAVCVCGGCVVCVICVCVWWLCVCVYGGCVCVVVVWCGVCVCVVPVFWVQVYNPLLSI